MKRVVSVFVPVMLFLKQGDRARRTQFSSILDLAVCSRVCPEASLVSVYLYQTFAHLEEHILRTIHGQCRGIDSLSTEPLRLEGAKFVEIEDVWEHMLRSSAVGTNEMKQLTSITKTPASQNDALTGRKPATNASLREIESTTLLTVKGDWPQSPKDAKPRNYAGFVVVPALPIIMHNIPTKLEIRKTKCHGSYSKVPKRVPIRGERMGSVKKTFPPDQIYLHATRAGLDRCRDDPAGIGNSPSVLLLVATGPRLVIWLWLENNDLDYVHGSMLCKVLLPTWVHGRALRKELPSSRVVPFEWSVIPLARWRPHQRSSIY